MIVKVRALLVNHHSRLAGKLLLLVGACFIIAGCKEQFGGILNPKGIIAFHERKLFFDTLALMLIVVLPVIVMSLTFIYHYQISHRIRDYKPDWGHSFFLESLWWGIPCVIIVVLAVITWKQTYELDPFKKITGFDEPPLVIQVIALPWKWLFIYPEQNIATLNYVEVPVGVQVEYVMTTDNVPMSAFFIPQLGSQIYAMAGMETRLHVVANEVGTYDGLNAQYNGAGFSDMHFEVRVVTPEAMKNWVSEMKKSPQSLTQTAYNQLLNPSIGDAPKSFANVQQNLFRSVVHLYMHSFGPDHPRNGYQFQHQIH